MRNCGVIDPESIDEYIIRGGYVGLENALKMDRMGIINEVSSGLRARWGWFSHRNEMEFAYRSPGDKSMWSAMLMKAIPVHSWIAAFWKAIPCGFRGSDYCRPGHRQR